MRPRHINPEWYSYTFLTLLVFWTSWMTRDLYPVDIFPVVAWLCAVGATALIAWYKAYRLARYEMAESIIWWSLYTTPIERQERLDQMADPPQNDDIAA